MANPEIDNYVTPRDAYDLNISEPVMVGGMSSHATPEERDMLFRQGAKKLLVATLNAIERMGYHVKCTNTNSDVDVKTLVEWFSLKKIKD